MRALQLSIVGLLLVSLCTIEIIEATAQPAKKGDIKTESEKKSTTERKATENDTPSTDAQKAVGGTCCGFGLLTMVVGGIAGLLFYMLPTFVGFFRKHPNMVPILVVNIFLGWTLVGYVVALAWAFTAVEEPRTSRPSRRRSRDDDDDDSDDGGGREMPDNDKPLSLDDDEEPIATYRVGYKGGHPDYPGEKLGAIDFQLFDNRFEFHPTPAKGADGKRNWGLETESWFKPLSIPFERVVSFEFEKTMGSLVISAENTIVITYRRKSGGEILIRFQISAITVYGQEKKCRELKDLMRNRGIFKKFAPKG